MSATEAPATHSPAWHRLRSQGIGASEVATIAGIGRWGSRWSIWAEKVGLVEPDGQSSEAQRMGLRMEATLARWFAEDTGLHVLGEQMMVSNREHPWIRATIDCLVGESPETPLDLALGPCQLKHTSDAPWCADCGEGDICAHGGALPPHIEAQGVWEMAAGGWRVMWFAALHSYGRLRYYRLEWDQASFDALFDAAGEFWHGHVLAGVPPALDGSDATTDALRRAYPHGGGEAVDIDDLADLLATRRHRKAQHKAMAANLAALDNELLARMGDADVGLVGGVPLVTLTEVRGSTYTVERKPSRRLDVRHPCGTCGRALRPQDEEKHKCK